MKKPYRVLTCEKVTIAWQVEKRVFLGILLSNKRVFLGISFADHRVSIIFTGRRLVLNMRHNLLIL